MTTSKARSLMAAACMACAAVGTATMTARAQPPAGTSEPTSPALDEIVVTADRKDSYSADLVQTGSFRGGRQLDTPLTINVITSALLEAQQAQGLLDALRNTAGVSPAQVTTTVYSNIAIRGIAVENRTNYRLNGILPIVNLIDLPLEDKDRIEALKGASALYYGFATPGGIVNLTMKRPTQDPYLAATLFGNSHGAAGAHVDVSSTWRTFGARVNAVYGDVDSGIDHTHGVRSLLAAALDFKPIDRVTLTLDAEHIYKSVDEPGVFRYLKLPAPTLTNLYPSVELPPLLDPSVNFGPDWAITRAEERNLLVGATWKISSAWALFASSGTSHVVRDRRVNSIDLVTYGPGTNGDGVLTVMLQPAATNENDNYRAEISGAANLRFMTHQLLLGVSKNIRRSFVSTAGLATCPSATPTAPRSPCKQNVFDPRDIPETPLPPATGTRTRVDDIGYYVFDRIEMASWLQVLVGVRKADYTDTNLDRAAVTFAANPTSVSYGVVIKPRPWLSVYGNYIEGLEATPPAPMMAANGGASLPATESTQREAGVKIELRPGLFVDAAYFNIEQGSSFVNGENVYVLDGRARFRGVEISMTGEVTPDWSLYATAQSLEAEQISGAPTRVTTNPITRAVTVVPTVVGRKIENAPERTISLATEHRLSRVVPGLSITGAAYYVGARAVNIFNQAFAPGYTVFDLGASYRRALRAKQTTFRITAQNVADKRYVAATGLAVVAQAPPRTFKFSVMAQF